MSVGATFEFQELASFGGQLKILNTASTWKLNTFIIYTLDHQGSEIFVFSFSQHSEICRYVIYSNPTATVHRNNTEY